MHTQPFNSHIAFHANKGCLLYAILQLTFLKNSLTLLVISLTNKVEI